MKRSSEKTQWLYLMNRFNLTIYLHIKINQHAYIKHNKSGCNMADQFFLVGPLMIVACNIYKKKLEQLSNIST